MEKFRGRSHCPNNFPVGKSKMRGFSAAAGILASQLPVPSLPQATKDEGRDDRLRRDFSFGATCYSSSGDKTEKQDRLSDLSPHFTFRLRYGNRELVGFSSLGRPAWPADLCSSPRPLQSRLSFSPGAELCALCG